MTDGAAWASVVQSSELASVPARVLARSVAVLHDRRASRRAELLVLDERIASERAALAAVDAASDAQHAALDAELDELERARARVEAELGTLTHNVCAAEVVVEGERENVAAAERAGAQLAAVWRAVKAAEEEALRKAAELRELKAELHARNVELALVSHIA
ncbi:hypothetical protein KFE25_011979 [Diacronema lutheri]|uniref:Uncharacterized protein n=2 Tax=Diacronema lutheri TaxID=2081491 RepID=A0A8J6C7T6_DIALT|nr:hypothetical protein KFE25_011979 [Diacronema lutheri]